MGRCTVLWPVCPDGHEVLTTVGAWAWCGVCHYLEERPAGQGVVCDRPLACRVHEDGSQDEYCRGHGLHFMSQFSDARLVSFVE